MTKLPAPGATLHDAQAHASEMRTGELVRIERRLRHRQGGLAAHELRSWYAVRAVLRERGVTVPPRMTRTAGLP